MTINGCISGATSVRGEESQLLCKHFWKNVLVGSCIPFYHTKMLLLRSSFGDDEGDFNAEFYASHRPQFCVLVSVLLNVKTALVSFGDVYLAGCTSPSSFCAL